MKLEPSRRRLCDETPQNGVVSAVPQWENVKWVLSTQPLGAHVA